jgi:hypothetical protein
MATTALSATPNQQSIISAYSNHSDDYIPKTSGSRGKQLCESQSFDDSNAKQQCCSSANTIDRAIDKAYENGVQSHLGIKAIQEYPCVTEYEMGKLSNDLHKKIQKYGIRTDIPEGLDPTKRPSIASEEIINFCKEVIFEKMAQDLGRPNDGGPISFTKRVLEYCHNWFMIRPRSERNMLLTLGD